MAYRVQPTLRGPSPLGMGSLLTDILAKARAAQAAQAQQTTTTLFTKGSTTVFPSQPVQASILPVISTQAPVSPPSPIPSVPSPSTITPMAMTPQTSAPMIQPSPGSGVLEPVDNAAESTVSQVATGTTAAPALPLLPIALVIGALLLFGGRRHATSH